ncbi:AEC family transporter [Jannaschia sp. Os4]|uniref:AEC family transporter n=1 Tax=Jannaschia sp. Os4 TaxID=2807617 RepID=UPI0019393968|nr:AEC family transporter [Jannaschia sp. Os4]
MTLLLTVLEIVAPVFLLAGVGLTWVRLGFPYDTAFVTRLAMTLAVPALIFTALMGTELDPAAIATVTLATFAAYAAVLAAMWAVTLVLRLDRRTYLAPLTFGNTGNLGIPLAGYAFGQAGLELGVVTFAVSAVLVFTVGLALVAGAGNPKALLREPMVPATLLGALFLWRGWETPAFLTNALELIGQMAIPLMLITLGVAVGRLRPVGLARVAALSVLKVVACAAIALAVAAAFGLGREATGVLTLQMATPVAVTSYLLAQKYGADAEAAAGLVVVSTALSVAAIPLLLLIVL